MSKLQQEFTFRTNNYEPRAEVINFVKHLTHDFYRPQDHGTLDVIRRNMGEFTNDRALRMNMALFSETPSGEHQAVMNEQYNAFADGTSTKVFSVVLYSGDMQLPLNFKELPGGSLPTIKKGSQRGYRLGPGWGVRMDIKDDFCNQLQFASIHHQLQNLVRSLSDKCKFFGFYEQDKERFYILGRPLDQASVKPNPNQVVADRFQMLISLHIPPVCVTE
jgi:hypothetical protein